MSLSANGSLFLLQEFMTVFLPCKEHVFTIAANPQNILIFDFPFKNAALLQCQQG